MELKHNSTFGTKSKISILIVIHSFTSKSRAVPLYLLILYVCNLACELIASFFITLVFSCYDPCREAFRNLVWGDSHPTSGVIHSKRLYSVNTATRIANIISCLPPLVGVECFELVSVSQNTLIGICNSLIPSQGFVNAC